MNRTYLIDGKIISAVRRVLYIRHGAITHDSGPLELTFADDSAVYFDAGPDGKSVKSVPHAWQDPFTGPLSTENRSYIEESGKWTAFDVSHQDQFRLAIGAEVIESKNLINEREKYVGLRIQTARVVIQVAVDSDELYTSVYPT